MPQNGFEKVASLLETLAGEGIVGVRHAYEAAGGWVARRAVRTATPNLRAGMTRAARGRPRPRISATFSATCAPPCACARGHCAPPRHDARDHRRLRERRRLVPCRIGARPTASCAATASCCVSTPSPCCGASRASCSERQLRGADDAAHGTPRPARRPHCCASDRRKRATPSRAAGAAWRRAALFALSAPYCVVAARRMYFAHMPRRLRLPAPSPCFPHPSQGRRAGLDHIVLLHRAPARRAALDRRRRSAVAQSRQIADKHALAAVPRVGSSLPTAPHLACRQHLRPWTRPLADDHHTHREARHAACSAGSEIQAELNRGINQATYAQLSQGVRRPRSRRRDHPRAAESLCRAHRPDRAHRRCRRPTGSSAGLAREELVGARAAHRRAGEALRVHLLPKDAADEKSAILEVRAGTGGNEAALFAADLFRMYSRYAELHGWKTEIISASESDLGGYKEIVASISGRGVFARLKYESGVHRVQRIPVTEAGGRIHTSAATVAVLPEAEEIDVDIKPRGHPHRHHARGRCRRPARQQDGLGRAHHPSADRHHRRLGREIAAPEPPPRHAGAALAPLRAASATRPPTRGRRRAQGPGRLGRPLAAHPHLQFPAGARHRPPHRPHPAQAARSPGRRRARRADRRPVADHQATELAAYESRMPEHALHHRIDARTVGSALRALYQRAGARRHRGCRRAMSRLSAGRARSAYRRRRSLPGRSAPLGAGELRQRLRQPHRRAARRARACVAHPRRAATSTAGRSPSRLPRSIRAPTARR